MINTGVLLGSSESDNCKMCSSDLKQLIVASGDDFTKSVAQNPFFFDCSPFLHTDFTWQRHDFGECDLDSTHSLRIKADFLRDLLLEIEDWRSCVLSVGIFLDGNELVTHTIDELELDQPASPESLYCTELGDNNGELFLTKTERTNSLLNCSFWFSDMKRGCALPLQNLIKNKGIQIQIVLSKRKRVAVLTRNLIVHPLVAETHNNLLFLSSAMMRYWSTNTVFCAAGKNDFELTSAFVFESIVISEKKETQPKRKWVWSRWTETLLAENVPYQQALLDLKCPDSDHMDLKIEDETGSVFCTGTCSDNLIMTDLNPEIEFEKDTVSVYTLNQEKLLFAKTSETSSLQSAEIRKFGKLVRKVNQAINDAQIATSDFSKTHKSKNLVFEFGKNVYQSYGFATLGNKHSLHITVSKPCFVNISFLNVQLMNVSKNGTVSK